MTDIIMQSYCVLDEIKQDDRYQEIKALDQEIIRNYQHEINLFRQTKEKYDQVMSEGGHYHPDFKDVVKAYSDAKTILYQKDEIKRYFILEKELQDEINQFLSEITKHISTHIKTPNKLGIVSKGGGSCHVG